MNRPLRITFRLAATGWAQSLLVAGVALIAAPLPLSLRLGPGLAMIGAGLFVAMWLVIDPAIPDAGAGLTTVLKSLCLLLFYLGSAWMVYGILSGGTGGLLMTP